MRRLLLLSVGLSVLLAFDVNAQRRRAVRPPIGVPSVYRPLYLYLDNTLTYFQNEIDERPIDRRKDTIYSAELITANGNRGPDLLTPQALAGVRLNLDALARMGVEAASVTIVYPEIDASFPRHDEYEAFFRSVAREVRDRRMKLIVKASIAFTGTAFANFNVDFSTLTVSKYAAGKRAMVAFILRDLQPDYLNLVGEPDTEASLTGLKDLNNASVYASVINSVLLGIDRKQTKIGAGTGTWTSPAFAETLAGTSIDYVDMHLYPVWPFALDNAFAIADAARRKGKGLAVTEAWLYKADPSEATGIAATPQVFRRDAFSFWAPLDEKFLRALSRFAEKEGLEFVSPFWSAFFFGNVEYGSSTANLSYPEIVQLANRAAVEAMIAGRVTRVGAEYSRLIRGADQQVRANR